jgi:hypothetical protein
MKKITLTLMLVGLISFAFGQTADLNGVTFGFGAGYSYSLNKTYDYSLTTDVNHNLKLQPLNNGAFVISSVVMVKLGKIAIDPATNTFIKQSKTKEYSDENESIYYQRKTSAHKVDSLNKDVEKLKLKDTDKEKLDKAKTELEQMRSKLNGLKNQSNSSAGISFWDHLSINMSLDMVNIASSVAFNKNVNGGLGLGYFITSDLQFALFYDVSQVSQLRDYVVNAYQDKPIPNGSGTNYTSLDTSDHNLFYNKTISGLSFKLIFSLANKKAN